MGPTVDCRVLGAVPSRPVALRIAGAVAAAVHVPVTGAAVRQVVARSADAAAVLRQRQRLQPRWLAASHSCSHSDAGVVGEDSTIAAMSSVLVLDPAEAVRVCSAVVEVGSASPLCRPATAAAAGEAACYPAVAAAAAHDRSGRDPH